MSARTFSTAVCRDCEATWKLARTYSQEEVIANLNEGERLALCPSCKSIRVSFPYDDPSTAPATPVVAGQPKVTREKTAAACTYEGCYRAAGHLGPHADALGKHLFDDARPSAETDRLAPVTEINPDLEDGHEPEHPEA